MNARSALATVAVVALCACQSTADTAVRVVETSTTAATTAASTATTAAPTTTAKASKPDVGHGDNTDELSAQMGEVSRSLSMVAVDASAQDMEAVVSDCIVAKVTVRQMQALLIDYDGPVTDLTSAGLVEYRAALDACIDGDLTSTVSHMNAGTAKINAATAEMGQS